MRTKNLLYFTLIIFFIFGSTIYSEASIREINFKEAMFDLETLSKKVWAIKSMTRVFDEQEISNQLPIIDPKIDYFRLAMHDVGRRSRPHLLQWNIEIDNKSFQIYVNRGEETVVIQGEAEDWKEKERVEHVLKLRAPSNFQIINEIKIFYNNDLG